MSLRSATLQIGRLFPVVAGGKVAALLIAEVFGVFTMLVVGLTGGDPASAVLKHCLIMPAMLVLVLGCADTVAVLRATGELELAVTLPSPARVILLRLAPVAIVAAVQVVVVGLALMTFLAPGQVALGWLACLAPVALGAAAVLYWNLRLRGPGAVLAATLLTLAPFLVWVEQAELCPENENLLGMSKLQVFASAGRCQLGLLLAALCLLALIRRRLDRLEEILDE
jgi:hypothetical protein